MSRKNTSIVMTLLALFFFWGAPALANENEVWWEAAKNEADREGYVLTDDASLKEYVQHHPEVLVVDARADYEFDAGHIPGAVNLEFDLADNIGLSEQKRARLAEVLGDDPSRPVVFYCRSFR